MVIHDTYLAQLCQAAYDPETTWDAKWTSKSVYVYCRKVTEFNGEGSPKTTYIIVFRGSNNLTDWIDDLKFIPSWHKDLGFCHAGFLEDMDVVVGEILALVDGRPLVITGHSLGAARACLLGALLTVLGVKPVSITVFGCPRPGFAKLRKVLQGGGFPLRSYQNLGDIVTTKPWFMGLYKDPIDFTEIQVFDWMDKVGNIPHHGIHLYVKGAAQYEHQYYD